MNLDGAVRTESVADNQQQDWLSPFPRLENLGKAPRVLGVLLPWLGETCIRWVALSLQC